MERLLSVALLVLALAVSPAVAGPTVPQGALSRVPDALKAGWRGQDERIAQLSREIEVARSACAVADERDALAEVRRDLRAALTVASNLEAEARADLQAAELGRTDARVRLDLAKLEERLAWDELRAARGRHDRRAARSRRNEARDQRKTARDMLRAANDAWVRAEEATRIRLRVTKKTTRLARRGLDELPAFAPRTRRISERELALLEARRELAVAQLEHERAVAVVQSGGRLDLDVFAEALADARAAEAAARRALREPALSGAARRGP